MERNIRIELGERSYPVHVGRGIAEKHLAPLLQSAEIAVVTDSNVQAQPWFGPLWNLVQAQSAKSLLLVVDAGEPSKDLAVFARLCSDLARASISRRGRVLAVGGGVIGDLAGYLAASYLRGIRFIQVPTTLLAAVDSSVGGKTGVNLPEGKNLVGAFYQPASVVIDLDFLETLPARELYSGMAEVLKYGVIRDPDLFAKTKGGIPQDLSEIIETSVCIKADVVTGDEKEESGLRAILNFGHTLGHAIEQTAGYGTLLHGEAIAIGMLGAAWISHRHAGLDLASVKALAGAIGANQLPLKFDGLRYEDLAPVIARDKKSTGSGVKWVLAPEIGRTVQASDVPEGIVREAVELCAGRMQLPA